jgi:preprotein translocase subunit SecG
MTIWNILRQFTSFYDNLVHFDVICYIFTIFGILLQEKSGNPAGNFYSLLSQNFEPDIASKFGCRLATAAKP